MKPLLLTLMLTAVMPHAVAGTPSAEGMLVADLPADGVTDVSAKLQSIIDSNPNRTIYIPDGTYLLGSPIQTLAEVSKSVALQLGDKAVLKASPDWNSDDAMINLGRSDETVNTTSLPGYFFCLDGGTLDCSGVAKGVAVGRGRNIQVRNLNIIDTPLGFHLKNGTNGSSSDIDVFNLNIVGNNRRGSVGMLIVALDNTFTNISISKVQKGIVLHGAAAMCRDFRISLGDNPELFNGSVAVDDHVTDNWFVNFDIDGYQTAFSLDNPDWGCPVIDGATVSWTGAFGARHTVISCPGGPYRGHVRNITVNAREGGTRFDRILYVKDPAAIGSIMNLRVNGPASLTDEQKQRYLKSEHRRLRTAMHPRGRECAYAASVPFPEKTVVAELTADGTTDVAGELQRIIDASPGATVVIPDGHYRIGKTVSTSSRKGCNVALRLANYAVIGPTDDFADDCLFDFGSRDGSGSGATMLEGGTLDCRGKTDGVKISAGKGSLVRYTVILGAETGIHIGRAASGTRLLGVNIEGHYTPSCTGVVVESTGNSMDMMRINDVHTGVRVLSSGNVVRNVHPLTYARKETFASTAGLVDEAGGNFYDFFYSDHFATGFYLKSAASIFNNCFSFHYCGMPGDFVALRSDRPFDSVVSNLRADITQVADGANRVLWAPSSPGKGLLSNLIVNSPENLSDNSHEAYIIE